jgi:hypothetical protein
MFAHMGDDVKRFPTRENRRPAALKSPSESVDKRLS